MWLYSYKLLVTTTSIAMKSILCSCIIIVTCICYRWVHRLVLFLANGNPPHALHFQQVVWICHSLRICEGYYSQSGTHNYNLIAAAHSKFLAHIHTDMLWPFIIMFVFVMLTKNFYALPIIFYKTILIW